MTDSPPPKDHDHDDALSSNEPSEPAVHPITDSKGRILPSLPNPTTILTQLPDILQAHLTHTPTAWTIPYTSRTAATKDFRQLPLTLGTLPIILPPTSPTFPSTTTRRPSIWRDPLRHALNPVAPLTGQQVRLAFEIFFEATMLLKLFDGSLWACYPKKLEVPMEEVVVLTPATFGGLEVKVACVKSVREDKELAVLMEEDEGWVGDLCGEEEEEEEGEDKDKEEDGGEDKERDGGEELGYGKLFKVSNEQLQFSRDGIIPEEERWKKTTGMTVGEVFVRGSIEKCKTGSPNPRVMTKKERKKRDGTVLGTTQFSRGVVWRCFTPNGKGDLEVLGQSAVHAMRNGMVRMTSFVKESLGVKVIA